MVAGDPHDMRQLLFPEGEDGFLLRNNGDHVPVSELEGKIIGLYFTLSSFRSCHQFTPVLTEVYSQLKEQGERFEVVAISLHDDEESFKNDFRNMPWLALPFNEKTSLEIATQFELSAIPTLVVIGSDGKTLHGNARRYVNVYGVQAYPFSPERLAELDETEKKRQESQTLESILVHDGIDFVQGKAGVKVEDMGSSSSETSTETSSDASDNEWEVAELVVSKASNDYSNKFYRRPYRSDSLTGKQYVINVLEGHEDRSLDMFRMKANVVYDLCDLLRDRKLLHDTRYVSVEEQICIFLYTIGHNDSNRTVANRFQHSGETISRHFRTVLRALCKFSNEVIQPPDMSSTPSYITSKGNKYYPWFKNCVGAIDGTHINASVPSGKAQIPYRGRKTVPTQNVSCACDFDMCFTFVLAGWEGTANDSRILNEALGNPQLNFPHPPHGKYYVVDSGFANAPGFLTPYKGERYHLNTYAGRDNYAKTAKERFNYAHSSLRNIIERCFGVLKARFPILKMMPSYSLRKQRNIVIASCALHNFIRRHALDDDFFDSFSRDEMIVSGEGGLTSVSSTNGNATRRQEQAMKEIRDEICKSMGRFYRLPFQ